MRSRTNLPTISNAANNTVLKARFHPRRFPFVDRFVELVEVKRFDSQLVNCNGWFASKFEEPFDKLRVNGRHKPFLVRLSKHERQTLCRCYSSQVGSRIGGGAKLMLLGGRLCGIHGRCGGLDYGE
jgi:hypothetical protein